MAEILWEWVFKPHSRVRKDEKIALGLDDWEFWKKVSLIPNQATREHLIWLRADDFQRRIFRVIDWIISDGINNFITYAQELDDSDEYKKELENRDFMKQLQHFSIEMKIKADTIDDTLDYVEDESLDLIFLEDQKIEIISELLEWYRQRIFEFLDKKEKHAKKFIKK